MTWVFTVLTFGSMLCNLINLNRSVSLFSQLHVMPTYECSIIFGTLLSGGIIMEEFSYYTPQQLTLIFIGSSICVIGIMWKVCLLELESSKIEKDDDWIKD